jgi:hypothetical protein
VRVDPDVDLAVCVHCVPDGAAVHLIRYGYDAAADEVPALPRLMLAVRLPETFAGATAFSPHDDLRVTMTADGGVHRLELTDVPLYGIVLLSGSPAA